MAEYRLYFLNPQSGHIDRLRTIEAGDDMQAISIAVRESHRPLEVWDSNKKVHRLEDPQNVVCSAEDAL